MVYLSLYRVCRVTHDRHRDSQFSLDISPLSFRPKCRLFGGGSSHGYSPGKFTDEATSSSGSSYAPRWCQVLELRRSFTIPAAFPESRRVSITSCPLQVVTLILQICSLRFTTRLLDHDMLTNVALSMHTHDSANRTVSVISPVQYLKHCRFRLHSIAPFHASVFG